jgi:hypothetical protein
MRSVSRHYLRTAIANTVFLNQSAEGIAKILPDRPPEDIQAAIEGAASDFVRNLDPDLQEWVLGVIVKAISTTYVIIISAGPLVTALSLLMKREKLFMSAGVAAS